MHVADFTLRLKDQSGTANRDNRRVYNEENRTQLEELDAVPRLGDDGQRVANALRLADAAPRPAMPPVEVAWSRKPESKILFLPSNAAMP